jgi:hypothetical protein
VYLDFIFNDGFTLVGGSGGVGIVGTSATVHHTPDESSFVLAGSTMDSGFTLPNGNTTVTFQVQAPYPKTALEVDADGNPVPLIIEGLLSAAVSDPCQMAAIINSGAEVIIPYKNTGDRRTHIITNRNVTVRLNK